MHRIREGEAPGLPKLPTFFLFILSKISGLSPSAFCRKDSTLSPLPGTPTRVKTDLVAYFRLKIHSATALTSDSGILGKGGIGMEPHCPEPPRVTCNAIFSRKPVSSLYFEAI